jgi:nucleotide-binding universal stress UspA family protein
MDTRETMALGFNRALVPLDGSMVAEAILPQFLRMAHALSMDVALIRVVVPPVKPVSIEEAPTELGKYAPTMERMLDEADNYLRSVAALPAFDGLKVMMTVRTGEAPQEIIASAKEISADVIAMTTHGRTASSDCCSDPSPEAVLRIADIPVFLLRAPPTSKAVMPQREFSTGRSYTRAKKLHGTVAAAPSS